MEYLTFEKPIEELIIKLEKAKELGADGDVDVSKTISDIEAQIQVTRKKIYENLSPWQKVQLSRHPQRPYTLDYIEALSGGDFIELHGDRGVKDDKAMVGGWGTIGKQSVMFIGQQKGRNTKQRQFRNFGMANPVSCQVTIIAFSGSTPGFGIGPPIAQGEYPACFREVSL